MGKAVSFLRISHPLDRTPQTQKKRKPHTPTEKTQAERSRSLTQLAEVFLKTRFSVLPIGPSQDLYKDLG